MALEPTAFRPSTIPSPAQLALAIIVLRSKPKNISITAGKEHLEILRSHVTDDRCAGMPGHKHLDGTAYWRQLFQKSELAQAQLLDRVHELEQEKDLNTNSLGTAETATAAKGKRKRDAGPEPMHKANSQAKRRAATSQRTVPSLHEMPSLPISSLPVGKNDTAKNGFLKHVFRLQQVLRSLKPDADVLATNFSELCKDAFRLVQEPVSSFEVKPSRAKALAKSKIANLDVAGITTGLETVFSGLYLAMNRITHIPSAEGHLDTMVVSLVELFHKILNEVARLFINQAQTAAESEKRVAKPKSAKSRAAKTQDTVWHKTQQDTIQLMAKLLQFMICSLDLEQDVPNKLLEGYGCVLLDHVGQCLSLQVFAQNIATVPNHPHSGLGQPKVLELQGTADLENRQRAVKQEGPLLIRLLEQLMDVVSTRQSLMSTKSPALFSIKKTGSITQKTFVDQVKLKLQNTLMQGVFGEDDMAFCNSLKIPEVVSLPTQTSPSRDESMTTDKAEWFTEEVWRLLGWENLRSLSET